jgi:hypothetical protein
MRKFTTKLYRNISHPVIKESLRGKKKVKVELGIFLVTNCKIKIEFCKPNQKESGLLAVLFTMSILNFIIGNRDILAVSLQISKGLLKIYQSNFRFCHGSLWRKNFVQDMYGGGVASQ